MNLQLKRLGLLVAVFVSLSASTNAQATRPNVLLIMADDLGFSDLGCYGGEIQTPNLDSIAEGGLRFSQFYNTARCWPTRSALLTGFYAQQIRRDALPSIPGGGQGTRPDWAVLLPKLLSTSGYRSYHTGKWHLDGMPVAEGFDRSYYLKDQGRFFNPTRHWKDDVKLPPIEKGTDFYATKALASHAIEVLKEHEADHADAAFFHYLAFAAPHFPLHALPEDIALYQNKYTRGWDAIRSERWKRMQQIGLLDAAAVNAPSRVERDLGPPYHFPDAFEILGEGEVNKPIPWKDLSEPQKQFQANKMAIHAAMIHRMDIEIGRVFDQIKQMGQWDNTVVIFLSDNGASAEIMVRDDGHRSDATPGSAETYLCLGPGWSTTCNTPFRRHKTWTHEGGTSTPLLVAWPKGIEARGEIRRSPGHVIDIAASLVELAGADSMAGAPPAPGKSLVPLFAQEAAAVKQEEDRTIWWFHDGNKAIRIGDWKAVAPVGEPWELYNLAVDRTESQDLAVPQADKLQHLVTQWKRHVDEFTELSSQNLPQTARQETKAAPKYSIEINQRQALGKPKRKQVLLGGKSFLLSGRNAFLMAPSDPVLVGNGIAVDSSNKPWIFYAPALNAYPDQAESWMHQRFLESGVAIAGIDVGEAYGSPLAFPHFEALYQHMVEQGYSKKPAMLGRSRGGLWVSSWAIEHPDRVAGIGGIYPCYDYTTYPGLKRAAPAYNVTEQVLTAEQDKLNPIKRASVLADAKIPVLIIHGRDDRVVPLAENSAALEGTYEAHGVGGLIEVIRIEDQGHSFWPGYFHCQELVDFLVKKARGK